MSFLVLIVKPGPQDAEHSDQSVHFDVSQSDSLTEKALSSFSASSLKKRESILFLNVMIKLMEILVLIRRNE